MSSVAERLRTVNGWPPERIAPVLVAINDAQCEQPLAPIEIAGIASLAAAANTSPAAKMSRAQVYGLINGERTYQDTKWAKPAHCHSATEYLVYIRHHTNKGLDRVSVEDGEQGALEQLRKIAALAVAAMEEHGAPKRRKPNELLRRAIDADEDVVYP